MELRDGRRRAAIEREANDIEHDQCQSFRAFVRISQVLDLPGETVDPISVDDAVRMP
jgi:hypothetical protein